MSGGGGGGAQVRYPKPLLDRLWDRLTGPPPPPPRDYDLDPVQLLAFPLWAWVGIVVQQMHHDALGTFICVWLSTIIIGPLLAISPKLAALVTVALYGWLIIGHPAQFILAR